MSIEVVQGFSLTNRWLIYTSLMLTPAQAISGAGSNCPSNIGFLAYNWYNQWVWYSAIQNRQLHALSLLPVHFNFIYVITYLGGVVSGNIFMGVILGFGTAGLIVLNTVAAWTSWITNLPEGYDLYEFFFFGWRTLNPSWRTFFLLWQIGDTILAINMVIATFYLCTIPLWQKDFDLPWWSRYATIPLGSVFMLIGIWPLILWTELIVARNHIESETDMIAVYLFIAQVGAMLIPSCTGLFSKKKWGSCSWVSGARVRTHAACRVS